jgi:hypothetical protein
MALTDTIKTYLEATHIPGVFAAADLATLLAYDISQRSGTYTVRFLALIADATA